jgi:hypothetical protein
MPGLDPGIHPLGRSWIAGSSPAMTAENDEPQNEWRLGAPGRATHNPRSESLPSLNLLANHKTYPRSEIRTYHPRRLAHRGRRLKRRRMTERGAVPDNGIALERREAQGPRAEGPRAPGPPPPPTGVPESRCVTPADRKAGEGSLASSLAPPGAPSPRGETEKGKDACRASLIRRPAERWLNAGIAVALPNRSRQLNAWPCCLCRSSPVDWSA